MDVAAFLAHNANRKPPAGTRRTTTQGPLEGLLEDAEKRAASGDWESASGRSFVGLYALCHRLTYGVDAVELEDRQTLQNATRAAAKALHVHFADDKSELVEFVKWVWEREKGRDQWAAQNGRARNRLGIRLQFAPALVTDYRVDQQRRAQLRRKR